LVVTEGVGSCADDLSPAPWCTKGAGSCAPTPPESPDVPFPAGAFSMLRQVTDLENAWAVVDAGKS